MAVTSGPDRARHAAAAAADDQSDPSIGQLASRLSEQVSRLVHDELALAQIEAKQKAKNLGVGLSLFGVGGVLAFFGAGCALAGAILGLANVVSAWLAALLVAAALFVVAGILALTGKKGVEHGSPPIPRQAVESTKADVAALRQAVKR